MKVKSVSEAVRLYVEKNPEAKAQEVLEWLGSQPGKSPENFKIATVSAQVAAARKALNLTKPRVKIDKDHLKEIFDSGKQEVSEVVEQLEAEGVEFNESTVRTYVSKLRKEANLGRQEFTIEL